MASSSSSSPNKNAPCQSIRDLVAPEPPIDLEPVYDANGVIHKTPTRMNYVAAETVKVTVKRDVKGNDSVTTGAIWQEEPVWVENGRGKALTLHTNGFELVQQPETTTLPKDIDFLCKDQVLDEYYPHCERLLKRYLGAGVMTVKAFDHNVRIQQQRPTTGQQQRQEAAAPLKPLGLVHGDYTTTSGPRRLQLLADTPKANDVWRERLGDQPLLDFDDPAVVKECLAGTRRFALINVWRSIDPEHVVESLPLACIDAPTHSTNDLRILELQYADRVGANFLATPSSEHQWYYFPHMNYNEAMLIKQWDSAGDLATGKSNNLATLSIHSAFLDPAITSPLPPQTPPRPRQSIEVRCVAIWDADG